LLWQPDLSKPSPWANAINGDEPTKEAICL